MRKSVKARVLTGRGILKREHCQRPCKQGKRKGILGSRPFFAILLLILEILSIFRNGRWRSEWSVSFQPSGGNVEVTGILKVQVII